MSFATPVDGQPAVAENVAQITETLKGNRNIPITLTGALTVQTKPVAVSPDAGNVLAWQANGLFVPTPAAGLTLPLTQHLTFSPDNTYDIGASGANRPRKIWTNTLEVADAGADTPATKFTGMTGFGGRVNIGGVGGADRIGWMVTGINTPSTTLMPGTTQTLWYAEYWANDAATAAVNGMDFGVLGPPSVKVGAMSLMRLRGIGARTLGPDYARGLIVEQITNGTIDNIGVEIRAPGTTGSGSNLALRSQGPNELQGTTYVGNSKDAWMLRDGPTGEFRLYAQSQLRLSLGYGSNYVEVPGMVRLGTAATATDRPVMRTPATSASSLSLEAPASMFFAAGKDAAHLSANAYWDGATWRRWNVSAGTTQIVATGNQILFYGAAAGANPIAGFTQLAAIDSAGSATFQGNVNIAGQFAGQGFTHGYVVCPYSGWVIDGWSKLVIVSTPGWWVYLPNGTSKAGYYVTVKNWSGGVITIAASGGQVIGMPGGTSPTSIAINSGEAYTFMSDGGAGMMVISKAV